MEKKHEGFIFRGAYSDLCELGTSKMTFVERDIVHFQKFGIAQEQVTGIRLLIEEVMNAEADESMMVNQLSVSIEKDRVKDLLRVASRQLITVIETSLSEADAQLINYFRIENLSKINEAELLKQASRLLFMVEKYADKLSHYQVPQELIADIINLRTELTNLCNQHEMAKADRKVSTIERHKKGNELYRLISKYCKIGRAIWMNENEVYYSNYVISTDSITPAEAEDNGDGGEDHGGN